MSNSANDAQTNATVSHNVYFDGKVQSLGLDTEKGPATLGVMKKGSYKFGTSSTETIIVISGVMKTKLPNADWQQHQLQQAFEVPAGISFDVDCESDVAYICYYA